MIRLPKLPAPPDPENIFSVIDKAGDAIEAGLNIIDKVADKFDQVAQRFGPPEPTTPTRAPESQKELASEHKTPTFQEPETMPKTLPAEEKIAAACVACTVGHFSTSSGLLKEALRFKGEGMTSQEVLDRIAGALEEQNALEREDLTQEKIQNLPQWERPIAEEALTQSRQLRHRLETIQSIDELEQLAADTRTYYLKLTRQWYRGRFSNLGAKKAETIAGRVGEVLDGPR